MSRGRTKKYSHLEEEWIRLYNEEGLNFSAIAKRFQVQSETVSKYIKHKVQARKRSRFNKDQIKTWVQEYQTGKTFADIARRYNVSETAVKTNIYKEIQPIIDELKWTWVSLYKKGKSLNTIGRVYHFHPKVVLNTIKDEVDLVITNNQNVYEPFIEEWKKLYMEGLSFQFIANKYNVSPDTVYRNIKDDVSIRSRKSSSKTIESMLPNWKKLYYDYGYTFQEISECYQVASSTIYRHLNEKSHQNSLQALKG